MLDLTLKVIISLQKAHLQQNTIKIKPAIFLCICLRETGFFESIMGKNMGMGAINFTTPQKKLVLNDLNCT